VKIRVISGKNNSPQIAQINTNNKEKCD